MSSILGRLFRSMGSVGNPGVDVGVGVTNVDNVDVSLSSRPEPTSPTATHNPVECLHTRFKSSGRSLMTHLSRAVETGSRQKQHFLNPTYRPDESPPATTVTNKKRSNRARRTRNERKGQHQFELVRLVCKAPRFFRSRINIARGLLAVGAR